MPLFACVYLLHSWAWWRKLFAPLLQVYKQGWDPNESNQTYVRCVNGKNKKTNNKKRKDNNTDDNDKYLLINQEKQIGTGFELEPVNRDADRSLFSFFT